MSSRESLLSALLIAAAVLSGCAAGPARAPADPHTVAFASELANRYVPADQSTEIVARLRVAVHAPPDAPRPPINLALVVDTSGSMEGKAIEDARSAARSLVGMMNDGDRFALVAFGSKTDVLLETTELDGSDRRKALAAIDAMKAEGTTDLAGGLQAGIEQVAAHLDPKGINRVVLVGDGVPNDESPVRGIAQSAGARGIAVTALGLGPDYNESLMGAIAQLSGGSFHYVDDSAKVASVLQDQVFRLETVYAKSTTVDVLPGPGVRVEGIIGRPTTPTGRGVRVALGDLSKGDAKDLFVKLAVEGHRDGAAVELVDAVLSFDDGVAGAGHIEERLYLSAHATASTTTLDSGRDAEVEDAAASARAAAATLEAIDAANHGDAPRAEQVLDNAADAAADTAKRNGDGALGARAASMRALKKALPKPAPPATPAAAIAPPPSRDPIARDRVLRAHDEAVNAF